MSTTKKPGPNTKVKVDPDPASNPDPITGAPESHPVGTAVGSATGAGADQGGTIELRMENVRGRFDFDNGKVSMRPVRGSTFTIPDARWTSSVVPVT